MWWFGRTELAWNETEVSIRHACTLTASILDATPSSASGGSEVEAGITVGSTYPGVRDGPGYLVGHPRSLDQARLDTESRCVQVEASRNTQPVEPFRNVLCWRCQIQEDQMMALLPPRAPINMVITNNLMPSDIQSHGKPVQAPTAQAIEFLQTTSISNLRHF